MGILLSWRGLIMSAWFAVVAGLLVLIMIQLYTANTSANLTTQQIKSQINSKDDLKDKTVVTWQDFTDSLRTYGINAVGVPW